MSVFQEVFVPAKFASTTQTTQFTVTRINNETTTAIIDSFTITNTGVTDVSISCNLVTDGDGADTVNLILDNRTLASAETYPCPELVGQILEEGDFISTIASLSDVLVLRVSGRLITEGQS